MRLKLLLDNDTATALMVAAVRELRPIDMQAEILLRRALGLPNPGDNAANLLPPLCAKSIQQ